VYRPYSQRVLSRADGRHDLATARLRRSLAPRLAHKVNKLDDVKSFVAVTVDLSSPHWRKFLTPAQFAKRYGQSDASI